MRQEEARAGQLEFGIVFKWIAAALAVVVSVFVLAYIALADPLLRIEKDMVTVSGGLIAGIVALLGWFQYKRG